MGRCTARARYGAARARCEFRQVALQAPGAQPTRRPARLPPLPQLARYEGRGLQGERRRQHDSAGGRAYTDSGQFAALLLTCYAGWGAWGTDYGRRGTCWGIISAGAGCDMTWGGFWHTCASVRMGDGLRGAEAGQAMRGERLVTRIKHRRQGAPWGEASSGPQPPDGEQQGPRVPAGGGAANGWGVGWGGRCDLTGAPACLSRGSTACGGLP